jgi:Icc-related predicted phosphoesterase
MAEGTLCFFASDLHGKKARYEKLFLEIEKEKPSIVLFGGDLLPPRNITFFEEYLVPLCIELKSKMGEDYPRLLMILGNDDARCTEPDLLKFQEQGIWEYLNCKYIDHGNFRFFGYSYVPPTPFLLKDWEKYDVSRFADPGCIHPNEGRYTVEINEDELIYSTIMEDLTKMTSHFDMAKSIFLFHAPPYNSHLDRAALDGMKFEHVPLDVHVGSIAIQRFIEERQPLITLHGHIHESSRITGYWRQNFNKTWSYSAAFEGDLLSLIKFEPETPENARRVII